MVTKTSEHLADENVLAEVNFFRKNCDARTRL